MAVVIPVGFGLVKFRYQLSSDAEEMIHTIGLEFVGTTSADATSAAQEVDAAWATQLCEDDGDTLAVGYTYLGVVMRATTSDGGEQEIEVPRNIIGAMGGAFLPNNTALLVRKTTVLGGRRHRGRMFLPPAFVAEGNVNPNGVIDGAQVATIQNRLDAFQTDVNSATSIDRLVILHNDTPAPVPDPTSILQLVLDTKVATQRRRMRR